MQIATTALTNLERDGFAVLESVVPEAQLQILSEAVEAVRNDAVLPGLRNLLSQSRTVREFATTGLAAEIAAKLLGCSGSVTKPTPVRGILFDKTPESNWYVTWHQDLSIPVREKVECEGYGPWSTKEGILHVQPPASILEKMVSLRIHLDPCALENGAIKFIAGSHLAGKLEPAEIEVMKAGRETTICPAARGDIIAMKPLILHASAKASSPNHRRVLHLEYTAASLPSGLEWAEA